MKLIPTWLLLIIPSIIFGQFQFSSQIQIDNSEGIKKSIFTCDVDDDGSEDILSIVSGSTIAWFNNVDGNGTFSSQKIITNTATELSSLYPIDIDGDNDIDVISGENELVSNNGTLEEIGKICLYENTDGEGTFAPRKVISSSMKNIWCVRAADLDNDSDNDIVSASHYDDKIAWYENTDGKGSFSSQIVLNTSAVQATFVSTGDLDGDNDLDILSSCRHYDNLVWYENTNNTFSAPITITSEAENTRCIYAVDIDNDNDLDVLASSWDPNIVFWYENIDGIGEFGNQQIISEQTSGKIIPIDFDLDGDLDILSKKSKDIYLHENIVETESFVSHKIITCETTSPQSIYANDLDADGDIDIIAGISDELYWFKNLTNITSAQESESELLNKFRLYPNYPNPFNPSTTIRFTLQKSEHISLKIYNVVGREVAELINGVRSAGEHQVLWQADGLPSGMSSKGRYASGVYFYQIKAGEHTQTKKMLLLR
ncbi:MAG: FG-GAP-like repeat-containing protein [Ignavibacteria bacterium]|jgi:hypothetical protein